MDEPVIAASARKRGIADEDLLHAYRNPIRIWDLDERLRMYIGADLTGRLLEVGVSTRTGEPRIVHAMWAREKFLR